LRFGNFDFVCPEVTLLLDGLFDAVLLHWLFVDLIVQQHGLPGVSGLVAIRCPVFSVAQQIALLEIVLQLPIFYLGLLTISRFLFAELLRG